MGVPVRGQQQADHHQRPDAPHHLHHQGGGLHQHWARAPLQPGPGDSIKKNKCKKNFKTFLIIIFLPHGYVFLSTYTDRFSTLLHNDPAAHQDHCGRCRIRTHRFGALQ